MPLLEFRNKGIYCPRANVYIDPWEKVERAIITHGHSDHARPGHRYYLTRQDNVTILKHRLGQNIAVEGKAYREKFIVNGVHFTLHPAGHIFGSSQVRIEYRGEVWVVSGDYKLQPDNISTPFEPVKCHSFVTESTFGLPLFQWKPQNIVFDQVRDWWKDNREQGMNTVLMGYSLGKAQRLIANLADSVGEIFVNDAIDQIDQVLTEKMNVLSKVKNATTGFNKIKYKGSLIITPSSGIGSPWIRKLEPYSLGMASGWMVLRGARRRGAADRGFIISDHHPCTTSKQSEEQ